MMKNSSSKANSKAKKPNAALQAMLNRISSGLNRLAVTTPSKWAETYRMMPEGLWNFSKHPWLREMHDSQAEKNVGQKAAQMGYTETLLNLAFFTIDVLARDVLYVLPNSSPNASDFSSGRFDPALELSPHLKTLFSDVHNIGHKRAGSANLYVRGSHSRSGLKSLPISTLLLDEVAEFVQENIPLAFERVSGQDLAKRIIWMISTPTVEGFGISVYYNYSDKKEFFFKCPSCSRHITLKFPESLVICGNNHLDPDIRKSHLICHECKAMLPHEDKTLFLNNSSKWVPQVANREWSGFTINQMYSTTIRPSDVVESYFKAQINPADEVEFFNSKLGMSHEVKGARVSDDDVDQCIYKGMKNRSNDKIPNGIITMGIDVGNFFHYEIDLWIPVGYAGDINLSYKCINLKHDKTRDIADIDRLMYEYRVLYAVIDAQPERRTSVDFCLRHPNRAAACFFGRGIRGKTIQKPKDSFDAESLVIVDRSSWLDLSLGRFRNYGISLPIDTSLEYREHIKAPVKHYNKDEDGNPVAKYLTQGNLPDHFAFARCYAEVALALTSMGIGNQTIEDM